jgi:uncharacterized protein (DUF927 family)
MKPPRKAARDAILGASPAAPSTGTGDEVSGFEMTPHGLYRVQHDKAGKVSGRLFICDPFEALAECRDADGEGWSLLLRWQDRDRKRHTAIIPRALLAGEAGEVRARLAAGGLTISTAPAARAALAEYLVHQQPRQRARTTPRTGWFTTDKGAVFVLPDETIGNLPGGELVLLEAPGAPPVIYRRAGTLAAWKADVAARCTGNTILTFAASSAFAGPLLNLLGEAGGGVHLFGKSRAGKSTALYLAASVWGAPTGHAPFMRSWRATGNALESTAAEHNDTLLPLDEVGQVDPRELGEVAYMLANGQGKGRAMRDRGTRPPITWRVLFLSTGERTLADVLAECGKRPEAGQEVRMVDLPADAGAGMGAFQNLHGAANPASFAELLNGIMRGQHGTAGPAFLAWLQPLVAADPAWAAETLRPRLLDFLARVLPGGADGQVRTVARRFGLIAIAGELATEAGITGWKPGEAEAAAAACFATWLAARGSNGAREDMEALARIRACLGADGQARFELWKDRHAAPEAQADMEPPPEGRAVMKRLGWRRWVPDAAAPGGGTWDYYFTTDGFREALGGLQPGPAARALAAAGHLRLGAKGTTVTVRIPGVGPVACYQVHASIMAGEDAVEGAAL